MADLVAGFFASRGQGKSTQVHHLIWSRKPDRLLMFDPMNEYGDHAERVSTLLELERRARAKTFRLRYVPEISVGGVLVPRKKTETRFNAWCTLAYHTKRLLMVADELQLVTRPSWSPPAWSACTLQGRHEGLAIVGVSQRPAHVDKDFFSCASSISAGRLNYQDDRVCLANVLGVTATEIGELQQFHFIARDMDSGRLVRGTTAELLRAMGRGPGRSKLHPQAAISPKKPAGQGRGL